MPKQQNDDIALQTMDDVLSRLERVRPTSRGWSARCPAHPDRTPSLSLAAGDTCVLVTCWAGCKVDEIAAAMGLPVAALFYRPGRTQQRRMTKRIDWRRQAVALEDEAITLWLHANEVFAFACNLDTMTWTDEDWDTATDAVCKAHESMERAAALEIEAFQLRKNNLEKEKTIGCTSRAVTTAGGTQPERSDIT